MLITFKKTQYLLLSYFRGLVREDWGKIFFFLQEEYHTHMYVYSITEYSKSLKYLREEKNREKKNGRSAAGSRRVADARGK